MTPSRFAWLANSMVLEEAHGTGAPIVFNAGAVRPPTETWELTRRLIVALAAVKICTECLGEGLVYGYYTNDPSEKLKSTGCPRCNGTGYEPEPEEEE